MNIQEKADAYADSMVQLKFARIDKLAIRFTATPQEVLTATTGVLNAKNAIKSARKALLDEATKGVKERLGWLAKVDPNQMPLHLGRPLNDDDDKLAIQQAVKEADSPDAVWHEHDAMFDKLEKKAGEKTAQQKIEAEIAAIPF